MPVVDLGTASCKPDRLLVLTILWIQAWTDASLGHLRTCQDTSLGSHQRKLVRVEFPQRLREYNRLASFLIVSGDHLIRAPLTHNILTAASNICAPTH
jgi:hypothetical protein